MQHKIFSPSNSTSATLIFLGWSTDANTLGATTLPPNTIAFFNYTSLSTSADLSTFKNITVIAWSMGVWAAEQFISQHTNLPIAKTIAINGTARPVDATLGISPENNIATRDNWSEASRAKFNLRMTGGKSALQAATPFLSARSLSDQRDELSAIIAAQQNNAPQRQWDKAFIGLQDKIFPLENMRRYWLSFANSTIELDMPHWPFTTLKDLNTL